MDRPYNLPGYCRAPGSMRLFNSLLSHKGPACYYVEICLLHMPGYEVQESFSPRCEGICVCFSFFGSAVLKHPLPPPKAAPHVLLRALGWGFLPPSPVSSLQPCSWLHFYVWATPWLSSWLTMLLIQATGLLQELAFLGISRWCALTSTQLQTQFRLGTNDLAYLSMLESPNICNYPPDCLRIA